MKNRHWLNLMLLGLVMFLPSTCHAQWYQGPSGGWWGFTFNFWDKSKNNQDIDQVNIFTRDDIISCIQVIYRDGTGVATPNCQPQNRENRRAFPLEPDEFIIGVDGRYRDHVNSLRLFTNKRTFDTVGRNRGFQFGYSAAPGQKIAAFFGRAVKYVESIGVLYVSVE